MYIVSGDQCRQFQELFGGVIDNRCGFFCFLFFLVVLLITGVGRPPLVGGNAGNDTDSSYFCSRPALGQSTGGNPALPLYSQNSIFNLPFPQLFGWRPHHAQLAAGLNDHKARGLNIAGGGAGGAVSVRARTQLAGVIGGR